MGSMKWRNKAHNAGQYTANGLLAELRSIDPRLLRDFRKATWFGLIALAALVSGYALGGIHATTASHRFATYGCVALMVVCGVLATRAAAQGAQRVAVQHAGDKAGTPLRIMILLVGYLIAAIAFCDLMEVDVAHLLIGGAITGIVVGLAAQPILGNLFAGLVLLLARPYVAGERVRVLSGAINGPHEGVIVSAGLLYTTLQTDQGPLNIPNSALMASALGVVTRSTDSAAETAPGSSLVGAAADRTNGGSATQPSGDTSQQARDLATAVAQEQAIADTIGDGTQKRSETGEANR